MRAYQRLLNYVNINTQSDEESDTTPTTQCQFDLAHQLVQELQELGVEDARVDELCYVYGTLPATTGCESVPSLGLIAHMDTAPDYSGEHVHPQIIQDYDGGDVALGSSGRILRVTDFPTLQEMKGRTLITTDGTTLLGSDDKSGIAEIMTMLEVIQSKGRPHGKLCIAFTPDEEVGAGADHFDVAGYGADFAYTLDGGREGEISYENFNADKAVFTVQGVNVHPGDAKDIMVNAQLVAMEINSMLPADQIPACTSGYEGFYHLTSMEGDVEHARLEYIVRDHDGNRQEERKQTLQQIESSINALYGVGTVTLTLTEQYRNMKEKIEPCMFLVDYAKTVIQECGLKPLEIAERGGTDGAMLSFMGLPCPNLGTGGFGFHGPYEHVTAEGMDLCVEILVKLVEHFATDMC